MSYRPRPMVLIILDGWGYREASDANAIEIANKPFWNSIWSTYPHVLLEASGHSVGLPEGQMGNSEVGHLNMGAGRVVYQDLTRIDLSIKDKRFFSNTVLIENIDRAVKSKKAIHILGLLSPGGVHSHERHIHTLIQLAKTHQASQIFVHAFLDGRDTPPRSAEASILALNQFFEDQSIGKIASLIGRYYAMDRDKRWDRTQKAYDLLTRGEADYTADNALTALHDAYARGESDEFVKAISIHKKNEEPVTIKEGDLVFFMNFRSDRARQLTRSFIDPHFTDFHRTTFPKVNFITLTEYDATYSIPVIYPAEILKNGLGDYLSDLGFHQLRIAETEKYAHVTFFFNGGIETPAINEERILIPSLKIATYDLQPEMQAFLVTNRLIDEIKKGRHDLIICNFANADMVGHTGNLSATIQTIEVLDICLKKIISALKEVNGEALITSDHGNAEIMFDEKTQQPHTAHTTELIPCLYIGRKATIVAEKGSLSDIAPTLLYLMGIPIPEEMTGNPLFKGIMESN